MGKIHDSSPFLFHSSFPSCPSYPSESTLPSLLSPSPPSPSFCSSRSNPSFNSPYKSSSSLPPLSHSSSSSHFPLAAFGPCPACKFHNRRCSEKCYLASFLPQNGVHNFAVVDSVFGSANVVNFLQLLAKDLTNYHRLQPLFRTNKCEWLSIFSACEISLKDRENTPTMFILQQNSSSSYIPLLLLLRDTSREDGEVHSDPKNNAEINIHTQLSDPKNNAEINIHTQLGESVNSDHVGELIQGRELAKQQKVHLSSSSSDIVREDFVQKLLPSYEKSLSQSAPISQLQNDVTKSPIFMHDSSAIVNSDDIHNDAAKKRVVTENGPEGLPDDGYRWKFIPHTVHRSGYYHCLHRFTRGCPAIKKVRRLDKDPTVFEIKYEGFHTCSSGQHSVPRPALPENQEEKQNNISNNDQQQQSQGTSVNSNWM